MKYLISYLLSAYLMSLTKYISNKYFVKRIALKFLVLLLLSISKGNILICHHNYIDKICKSHLNK